MLKDMIKGIRKRKLTSLDLPTSIFFIAKTPIPIYSFSKKLVVWSRQRATNRYQLLFNGYFLESARFGQTPAGRPLRPVRMRQTVSRQFSKKRFCFKNWLCDILYNSKTDFLKTQFSFEHFQKSVLELLKIILTFRSF